MGSTAIDMQSSTKGVNIRNPIAVPGPIENHRKGVAQQERQTQKPAEQPAARIDCQQRGVLRTREPVHVCSHGDPRYAEDPCHGQGEPIGDRVAAANQALYGVDKGIDAGRCQDGALNSSSQGFKMPVAELELSRRGPAE